jgi:hypothetical protein
MAGQGRGISRRWREDLHAMQQVVTNGVYN